ncbi:MAG: GAF domain-containing protein [Chloroflexi bacterium]|nr:GAF domain-containing protein [Chloroflexota bacterium]
MTQIKLKRLLSKKQEAAAIVSDLIEAINTPISVQDREGNTLMGAASAGPQGRYPITCSHNIIGWTIGQERAELVATLLTHLANKEAEKDTLADEMLERYRELNLLYHLSEKLATSLELAAVAQTALDEASRLIKATAGWVMLLDEGQADLDPIAAFGQGFQPQQRVKLGEGIIGGVALNGKAELVNDIQADARYVEGQISTPISSLICAPLKTKNQVIGVIALGVSEAGVAYLAADLKLLNTLASQAAPAIENALLYEKTLREAREREERLQRQIQDLRIELDEARQAKQVAEITGTDYFQQLRSKANDLREMLEGEE